MLIGAYDPMSCPNPCASSGCFAVYSAGTVVASVMIGLLLAHGGSLHIKADDPRRRGIARWDGRMSPTDIIKAFAAAEYSGLGLDLDHFSRSSQPQCPQCCPAHAVWNDIRRGHVRRMLIGACGPTVMLDARLEAHSRGLWRARVAHVGQRSDRGRRLLRRSVSLSLPPSLPHPLPRLLPRPCPISFPSSLVCRVLGGGGGGRTTARVRGGVGCSESHLSRRVLVPSYYVLILVHTP